jgi:hypothetical protein
VDLMLEDLIEVSKGNPTVETPIEELMDQKLVRQVKDKFLLTGKGVSILDDKILLDINKYIDDYRKLFAGIKPGSMGQKSRVINNLKWFFKETNFKYSMKDIMNAAEEHINSNGFYNDEKLIRQADYFIKKTIVRDGEKEVISDLLLVLEELENTDSYSSDWTAKLI